MRQMDSLTEHISSIVLYILLCIIQTNQGTVTQIPSHACVGEDITVDCSLTVPDPNNNNFRTLFIEFIIGSDPNPLSDSTVNTANTIVGGVNLNRLTAFANGSFSTAKTVLGSLTLSSYANSDANLRLGCSALYFLSGTSGTTAVESQTLQLTPAAPPPPVIIQNISSSNIDASTCTATVTLNWLAPSPTNRTVQLYYLTLQNGTAVDSTAANTYSHSTTLLLNTLYSYSLTASSCAGNSTLATIILNSVNSFSLQTGPSSVYLSYNNESSMFTINWGLSTESTPLLIQYSLRYNYSHTQGSTTIESSSNIMTSFSILSNAALTYAQSITAANFVGGVEVRTDITACLRITQQCGQSYSGVEMCNSTSSIYAPLPSTPVMTSTLIQPSSMPTASSTYIFIPPTPTPTTVPATNSPTTNPNTGLNIGVPLSILFAFLFLVGLVLNILFITVFVVLLRKIKHLKSVPKAAPSHGYEYIYIDKMGGSISSPTQQPPQDYVPMSSVLRQDNVDTAAGTTQYANLK